MRIKKRVGAPLMVKVRVQFFGKPIPVKHINVARGLRRHPPHDYRKSDESLRGAFSSPKIQKSRAVRGRGVRYCWGVPYPVVVENVCGGPWIYSARESNTPIVEELRMDVPGPVICGLFL